MHDENEYIQCASANQVARDVKILPFLLVAASQNFDLHACYSTKKFKSIVMEASVVMKEDKKTKIKTFSAEYARSA